MVQMSIRCTSLPSVYSFDTDEIKATDVEYSYRTPRNPVGCENVEETHALYLNDGTKVLLMTIENDEFEENTTEDDRYLYCLQVYSQEEVQKMDDPHLSLWASKKDSDILKKLCKTT
jgi:hypothetical protein